MLVENKVITIALEHAEDLEEGTDDSDSVGEPGGMKELEKKMEAMMWKFNFFIVCVAFVVIGVALNAYVMT